MGEFDPAPGAAVAAPDDEFAPAPGAPIIAPPPAAPAPAAPPSLLSRVASQVAQPFKDIGHGVMEANRAVTHAIFHPVDTARSIAANPTAYAREALRGVNDNIPLANTAVQAIGGPAADSPEDAAAAPGVRALGGLAAAPVGGELLGGIAAKVAEKAAPVVARAVQGIGESAEARNIARTKEALELKVNKGTRAGLKSDVVDQAIAESPELQKAAGNDAKVAEVTGRLRQNAGTALDQIYTESAAARAAGASDLQALSEKATAARTRANELHAAAHPELGLGDEMRKIDAPISEEPSLFDLARGIDAPVSGSVAREMGRPAFEAKQAARAEAAAKAAAEAKSAEGEAFDLEKQLTAQQKAVGDLTKAPPVDISKPVANVDERIADLKKGDVNDAAAAKKLQTLRDEFNNRLGERAEVTTSDLRAEQSAYQKNGYAKNIAGDPDVSATILAHREMSKAVGDAVVEHVTGMKYEAAKAAAATDPGSIAAKVFKANDHISAANRIDAGIADRASRVKPPTGPLAVVKRVASHAVGPALMGATHGPLAGLATAAGQEVLHAAPGALRAGASAIDRGIAAGAARAAPALRSIGQAAGGGTMLQRIQAAAEAGNPRAAKLLASVRTAGAPGTPPVGAATSGTLATQ